MAKIDVILPVYNAEKVIVDAIESIFNQTFSDWRLIVCDDGSADNTVKILIDYERKYPDKVVALINKENKGITYALNKMLRRTNAKYIARMDADDKSRPDRFEKQLMFLEKNSEYAIVGSSIMKFDENGEFALRRYPEKPEKKDFLWNSPFAHPSIMIRKEVIDLLGGYWDKKRTQRCEDYDLWMRLYAADYKGYNIQEPLLEYYEGRNSYGKRKFRYRIAEMKTRLFGYKRLGLLPLGLVYACKPLLVGMIPRFILVKMRKGYKS